MKFLPIPNIHYRPCTLCRGKAWFIAFYVQDPQSQALKRIRIKVNRCRSDRAKREQAQVMMAAIDQRLALGWNPLIETKAPKAFEKFFRALDTFLKVKDRELEADSIRSYHSFVQTFRTWLLGNGYNEQSYAANFSRESALSFMDWVEGQVAPRTYNNYLAFFRGLFTWMQEKGYADANPFASIPKKAKRLTKKTRRMLNDGELRTLIAFLERKNPEYLAMVLLCYCCFVRPKELALLRCGDIDLEKQRLHIAAEIAKNDNESYRTIPDEMVPYLRKLDLSRPELYLFGNHKTHGDFRPGTKKVCSRKIAAWWNNDVRPACKFGMEVKFYSLKDTGITNMIGAGVPINLAQQQADHSSVAMTAIYIGRKSEATEALKKASIIRK